MLGRLSDGALLCVLIVFTVAWAAGVFLLVQYVIATVPVAAVPLVAALLWIVAVSLIALVPGRLAVGLQNRIYRHKWDSYERK